MKSNVRQERHEFHSIHLEVHKGIALYIISLTASREKHCRQNLATHTRDESSIVRPYAILLLSKGTRAARVSKIDIDVNVIDREG